MKVWVLVHSVYYDDMECMECTCGCMRQVRVFSSYEAASKYAWDHKCEWWLVLERDIE